MNLNTREQALLIWLVVVVAAVFLSKTVRPSFLVLLRSLFQRKIVDVVGLAGLYVAGCIWALHSVGVWDWDNLKTSVLWFFTTAFVAMANTKALESGPSMLGTLVREAVTVAAIVTFVASMSTLPLWAELLLLPCLSIVAMMVVVAERQPQHRIVIGLLNAVLVIAGFYLLGYSAYHVIGDWRNIDAGLQAREFVVPLALTVMFTPYLYGLMLYISFEQAAIRLSLRLKDDKVRRYAWWRGLAAFGLHPTLFSRFIHAVQMFDVKDKQDLKIIVGTMHRAFARERIRPEVDSHLGWSPDDAVNYLDPYGLTARPYHPSLVNWTGESAYLKLQDSYLSDHLIYRISGTEQAATEVELELDVTSGPSQHESDDRFWQAAEALVLAVLGDETSRRLQPLIPSDKSIEMTAGLLAISVWRDDWSSGTRSGYSRRLRIRHPAFVDPLANVTIGGEDA